MAGVFVLNRTEILDRLGGDEEIFTMMVDMYLQDVENNCETLAAAYKAGVALPLQREAHTIKGLLATFSDNEGAAEAATLEQKAKMHQFEGLDVAVVSLQARLREVGEVLKSVG